MEDQARPAFITFITTDKLVITVCAYRICLFKNNIKYVVKFVDNILIGFEVDQVEYEEIFNKLKLL